MKLLCLPPKTSAKRAVNASDACIPCISTPVSGDSGISTGDATPSSVCQVLKFNTAQVEVRQS